MKDGGLTIQFDGKTNYLFWNNNVFEYPIGGLICEYATLQPTQIKEIIDNYKNNSSKANIEITLDVIDYLIESFKDVFSPTISAAIIMEFINAFTDIYTHDKTEIEKHLSEINKIKQNDSIKEFILDSKDAFFSFNTMKDILNYAYYAFSQSYIIFKKCFIDIFESTDENNDKSNIDIENNLIDAIVSFYTDNFEFQHIEYNIIALEGKLVSIYTINSSLSLLLFELAHMIESDITYKKCKNCGRYFIPIKRIDTEYCNFPSPQDHLKTCKQIGAQFTRIKKEKEDEFTKEYRKIYMRMQMKARRHPKNITYQNELRSIVEEAKYWRRKIKTNDVDDIEWKSWLKKYIS